MPGMGGRVGCSADCPFSFAQKYQFEKTDRLAMNTWTLAFTGPGDIEVADCIHHEPFLRQIRPGSTPRMWLRSLP